MPGVRLLAEAGVARCPPTLLEETNNDRAGCDRPHRIESDALRATLVSSA